MRARWTCGPGPRRRSPGRWPGNPIGWLYGAAGLAWAYTLPLEPWVEQLRDQVDLDALKGELLGVVDQTVQPTSASLWLRHAP